MDSEASLMLLRIPLLIGIVFGFGLRRADENIGGGARVRVQEMPRTLAVASLMAFLSLPVGFEMLALFGVVTVIAVGIAIVLRIDSRRGGGTAEPDPTSEPPVERDRGADGTTRESLWGYGTAAAAFWSVLVAGPCACFSVIVVWLFPSLALVGINIARHRSSRLSMCIFFGATLGYTATWAGVAFNRIDVPPPDPKLAVWDLPYNPGDTKALVGFPFQSIEIYETVDIFRARLSGRGWSYLIANFCLFAAAFTALGYAIPRCYLLGLNLAIPYLALLVCPLALGTLAELG